MRPDALSSLRHALLLAAGLGGCTAVPPGDGKDGEIRAVDGGVGGTPGADVRPDARPPAGAGYVRESDGTVHRAGPQACSPLIERAACTDQGQGGVSTCKTDAQCGDRPYGKCVQDAGQIGQYCRCDYACAADSDCKAGEVCACGEAIGGNHHSMCVPARCASDSDCAGGACGLSVYFNGCSEAIQLACRTAGDTCKTGADCPQGQVCAASESGAWTCQGRTCVIGRPLLVEGAARTAPATSRSDWLADLELEADVSLDVAAALADHWTEVAALEHASVASFARFTIELLAHAAPPDIVADSQRAALDEIDHARMAWSLASLWSSRPLGPGPLAVTGLALARDLEAMTVALVKEGCVGETLGAAEARMQGDRAGHPTMAAIFAGVAHDEEQHAALAWRTLKWLLSEHGDRVRVAALAAAAEAEAELLAEAPPPAGEVLSPAWGLVGREALLAHRREAFDAVVRPVLRAVLGQPAQA